jgi:hypothetical protein
MACVRKREFGPRPNKFGAKSVTSDYPELAGHRFPSTAERTRAHELVEQQRLGLIAGLELQPRWTLSTDPRCVYTADFQYRDVGGIVHVEDVKGALMPDARVRILWVRERYGVQVELLHLGRGGRWERTSLGGDA